jgi:hypothetical protein
LCSSIVPLPLIPSTETANPNLTKNSNPFHRFTWVCNQNENWSSRLVVIEALGWLWLKLRFVIFSFSQLNRTTSFSC